jgi:hypothetical protein
MGSSLSCCSVLGYNLQYPIEIGASTFGFAGCHQLISYLSREVWFKVAYSKWHRREQLQFELLGTSLVHALLVTFYSFYRIGSTPQQFREDPGSFSSSSPSSSSDESLLVHQEILKSAKRELSLIAFMGGYFVYDFYVCRKIWLKTRSDVVHHLLALGVVSGVLWKQVPLIRLAPLFSLLETSTIFLDLLKMGKLLLSVSSSSSSFPASSFRSSSSSSSSSFLKGFLLSFVSTFFLGRIVWLPFLLFYVLITRQKEANELGSIRYYLVGVWFLQVYWFRKIFLLLKRASSSLPSPLHVPSKV